MPRQKPRTKGNTNGHALLRMDLPGRSSQQSGGTKGGCGSRSVCRTPGMQLWLQLLPLAPAREEGQLCPADWTVGGRGWRRLEMGQNASREAPGKQERINGAAILCVITHGREGQTIGRKLPGSHKEAKAAGRGPRRTFWLASASK